MQADLSFLNDLNEKQREAVECIYGPLLIIAGAGTGKTKTMISRAAYMIATGISPRQILMLTFTNKAAKEMKDRLEVMLGEPGKDVTASTFHSFFAMLLRHYGTAIGVDPNFVILSSSDEADVIDIVKAESSSLEYEAKGFPPSRKIVSIISKSYNTNRPIELILAEPSFEKYGDFQLQIEEIKGDCERYKKANNLLNYDDILLRCVALFKSCPHIAKRVAKEYPFVMVDEYQDTNCLQEDILRSLFEYTKNIAVVGDDMQALYRFRGATYENILTFSQRYEQTHDVFLTVNYRSNQEILDLANVVVANTVHGYKKNLIGTHKAEYKPRFVWTNDIYQEADAVFENIRKRVKQGERYDDIAVLARSSRQTAQLEALLMQNRVPYVKYGGVKFFELSYVKDILSYLRVLTNPKDEIAWFRILQVHYGVGKKYAHEIAAKCKEVGKDALLAPSYMKRMYGVELQLLYNELDNYSGLSLQQAMDKIVAFYVRTLTRAIQKGRMSESKKTELLENLKSQQQNELEELKVLSQKYNSISAFLDDIILDNTKLTQDPDKNGQLVLSTIHSAKGLEFNSVIMMDCVDEVFPSTSEDSVGTDEDEDELRCFYVAVTRAKKDLAMFAPHLIFRYGETIVGEMAHYIRRHPEAFDVVEYRE